MLAFFFANNQPDILTGRHFVGTPGALEREQQQVLR